MLDESVKVCKLTFAKCVDRRLTDPTDTVIDQTGFMLVHIKDDILTFPHVSLLIPFLQVKHQTSLAEEKALPPPKYQANNSRQESK